MGLGLGAVVQSKHALHDIGNVGGHMHGTGPSAVCSAGMLKSFQLDIKGLAEIGHGAGKHHASFGSIGFDNRKLMVVSKGLDARDFLRISSMGCLKLLTSQVLPLKWRTRT